jgi:hypothetical protein
MSAWGWEMHFMIHYADRISEEFLATGDPALLEILSDIVSDIFIFAPEA